MITVVVPTIRADQYAEFLKAWELYFKKHDVRVVTVWDGDEPVITDGVVRLTSKEILGDDADLIYHRTDACRNLGFAYVAKYLPKASHIITLDDDTRPDHNHDAIAEHLRVLGSMVPVSWLSSVGWGVPYMRGFPYGCREEATVTVSHGVWTGIPDMDAKTQQAHPEMTDFQGPFYVGPVPRGIQLPFCGMNVGFTREALPWMYYAPMGPRTGYHRWADILLGMSLTNELPANMARFSGASVVRHDRASNLERNLEQEALSVPLGEAVALSGRVSREHIEYAAQYTVSKFRWFNWINTQLCNT